MNWDNIILIRNGVMDGSYNSSVIIYSPLYGSKTVTINNGQTDVFGLFTVWYAGVWNIKSQKALVGYDTINTVQVELPAGGVISFTYNAGKILVYCMQ